MADDEFSRIVYSLIYTYLFSLFIVLLFVDL